MVHLSLDKDPRRLRGIDLVAHEAFREFEIAHGRALTIDEPIGVVSADPQWPEKFQQEAVCLRAALPLKLVPDIQHIGSTSVPGLDGKPVIDIMVGISDPKQIETVVLALERFRYENLGQAGVPGRWAMRRRTIGSYFNVSIIAYGGARWRQNLSIREFLRSDRDAASRYGAAKREAIARGAATLFAYSDGKRSSIEAIARAAEQRFPTVAPSVDLVEPNLTLLPAFTAALDAGWSPDTRHDVSAELLTEIREDPRLFVRNLARQDGGTRTLAEGAIVPWLPSRTFWIWNGDFCGSIELRFVPGSEALPPHVSGHVSYSIVPWKRNRGYARQALHLLLPIAHSVGLRRLLISCDEDNIASRRVIEANGGVPAEGVPQSVQTDRRSYWVSTVR
jgi:GrpB-like predicted nucleotidyltransferase (UPF0157 family)/predicted acetyltransferase